MKIDILTLFPNMFDGVFSESIIKRAIEAKKVEINIIDFRKYTNDPHNKVDDTPYGGGAGMVLMPQPIFDCVEDIRTKDLTNDQINALRSATDDYVLVGDLKREVEMNIKTKMEIGSYQGIRHKKGLPVRGQRTSRNARTRKGKPKTIANKKK